MKIKRVELGKNNVRLSNMYYHIRKKIKRLIRTKKLRTRTHTEHIYPSFKTRHNKLKIGMNIGDETMTKEYKEYHPPEEIAFKLGSRGKIKELLKTNNWENLSNVFESGIKSYIEKYIPKYMISYANTEIEYGDLIIGVSDNGDLYGFPLTSGMQKNKFKKLKIWIMRSIIKTLKMALTEDEYSKYANIIIGKIQIEIDIFDKDDSLIDDGVESYITKYESEKEEYERTEKEITQKRTDWLKKIDRYKQAINTMTNEQSIRLEIIDYVKTTTESQLQLIGKTMKSNSERKINNFDVLRNNALARLENKEHITFAPKQISDEKDDPKNIAFWITAFRDAKVYNILKEKPESCNRSRPVCPYYKMFRDMRPMIKRMMDKNGSPGMKMAMLKIRFPGRLNLNNIKTENTENTETKDSGSFNNTNNNDDNNGILDIPLLRYIDKNNVIKYYVRELDLYGKPVTLSNWE